MNVTDTKSLISGVAPGAAARWSSAALLLIAASLSAAAHVALRIASAPFGEARVFAALAARETWIPLGALALFYTVATVHLRLTGRYERRLAEEQKKRFDAEHRAIEQTRLTRALSSLLGETQTSFDPERRIGRFAALLHGHLKSQATLVLIADESRHSFRVLEAVGEDGSRQNGARAATVPLPELSRDGIVRLSFEAGAAGLLAPLLRERFGASVGFAAPILRGKTLAGALIAGYRDPMAELPDSDRELLLAAGTLSASLFESRHLDQQLRSVTRSNSGLVRTVWHALATPLHVVLGHCDLLRESSMSKVYGDQLDRMKQSAIQLAEHIDSVVTLARLEGDGELVHWREVDMTGFLRDLGNSIPGYWRKESVKLRWSADAGRNVRTDPDKLKFLLRHLIRNALKFTQHGEVAVSMSIAPGTLQFTIRDTGPGIPSEVKQGIVQMLDTSTPPGSPAPGGVGLGLYLACRMVRELWGDIRFDSEGGKGSSVHVMLPIEEAPRELALADEEPPPLLTADG